MPRPLRPQVAGGVFHVYARGNDKQAIFLDDTDRERYIRLLGSAVVDYRWRLLSYCLMPNHVHLLVETPEPTLAAGMQRMHGTYAQTFNRRHDRSGHLFQGRYGSVTVEGDIQLVTVVRYIARNPVEAELVEGAEDWPWSSHRAIAGGGPAPRWLAASRLMDLFSGWGPDPHGAYRTLTQP